MNLSSHRRLRREVGAISAEYTVATCVAVGVGSLLWKFLQGSGLFEKLLGTLLQGFLGMLGF